MPASVMYKIIVLFILKRNNAKEILTEIKKNFNKKITYNYICRQLQTIRKILAEYFKIKYRENNLVGIDHNNNPHIIAIDESLFSHDEKGQIWIVGGVDTNLKNIRLDILRQRNAENIETFVLNHFREGTHFTHDGWSGYNFFNNNINYTHEIHNHGAWVFGLSTHIISHI